MVIEIDPRVFTKYLGLEVLVVVVVLNSSVTVAFSLFLFVFTA